MCSLKVYEEVLQDFTKALELEPRHASGLYGRGKARNKYAEELEDDDNPKLARENYLGSLRDFNKAIHVNPCLDKFYNGKGVAYQKLAYFYWRRNDPLRTVGYFKKALVNFDKAIKFFDPEEPYEKRLVKAYINRGMTLMNLAELAGSSNQAGSRNQGSVQLLDDALASLNKATDVVNSDACRNLHSLISRVYLSKTHVRLASARRIENDAAKLLIYRSVESDFKNAIETLEKLPSISVDLVNAYFLRANARLIMGKIHERVADFEKIVELVPQYAPASFELGRAYYSISEYDNAVASFSKTVELDTGFSKAIHYRGKVRCALGRHEDAIGDYTLAVKSDPKNSGIYLDRGTAHVNLGNFRDAIKDYTRALKHNPKSYVAMVCRGTACLQQEDFTKAENDFNNAIELNGNLPDAYFCLGMLNSKRGEFEQSVHDYSNAIDINSSNHEYYLKRGHAKCGLKMHASALDDYSLAVELNQDNDMALAFRARLNFLMCANNPKALKDRESLLRKLGESMADFDRAIQLEPKNPLALEGRSEVMKFLESINSKDRLVSITKKSSCSQRAGRSQKPKATNKSAFNEFRQELSVLLSIADEPESQSRIETAPWFGLATLNSNTLFKQKNTHAA